MSNESLKRGVYLKERMVVIRSNLWTQESYYPQKSLGILGNQDGNADENVNQKGGGCDYPL